MKFRRATVDDAELLLAWRNDPQTRAMSHNTGEIALAEHLAWLQKTLADSARELYVVEEDGVPVGTVRAERAADGAVELSWTVAPEARGKGIGRRMVRHAASLFAAYPVRAEVKADNIASKRIAEAAGLRLEREVGDLAHFVRAAAR